MSIITRLICRHGERGEKGKEEDSRAEAIAVHLHEKPYSVHERRLADDVRALFSISYKRQI